MHRDAGFGPVKDGQAPVEMGEMDPPESWRSLVVFAGAGAGNPIGSAVSGIYPCGPPGWIHPSHP